MLKEQFACKIFGASVQEVLEDLKLMEHHAKSVAAVSKIAGVSKDHVVARLKPVYSDEADLDIELAHPEFGHISATLAINGYRADWIVGSVGSDGRMAINVRDRYLVRDLVEDPFMLSLTHTAFENYAVLGEIDSEPALRVITWPETEQDAYDHEKVVNQLIL